MKIQINKDLLTEYKDAVWKGFTVKELLCMLCGGGIAIGVVFLLHRYFGMYPATAIYLAVPFALPPVLIGFFRYQGYMGPVELIREYIYSRRCRRLTWDDEPGEAWPQFGMKRKEETAKRSRRRKGNGIYDQSGKAI